MTSSMGPIYDRSPGAPGHHRRDGHPRPPAADRRRPGAHGARRRRRQASTIPRRTASARAACSCRQTPTGSKPRASCARRSSSTRSSIRAQRPALNGAAMKLEDYLAIPYRLVAYSAGGPDGSWRRFAAYPEIGCRQRSGHALGGPGAARRAAHPLHHRPRPARRADPRAAATAQVADHGARPRAARLCQVAGRQPASQRGSVAP